LAQLYNYMCGDSPENWAPRVPPFQVIQGQRFGAYDLPLVIRSNHGPVSNTIWEINDDFSQKNYFLTRLFNAFVDVLPSNFVTPVRLKK